MPSDPLPLKIAYLVNFCHKQGTYFRFHSFAKHITRMGHEVTVFAQDGDPTSQARIEVREGVTYHIVPNARGDFLFGGFCNPIPCVQRLFEPYQQYDIAHLWQPFPSAAVSWLTRMKRLARVRIYDWDDLWHNGLMPPGGRTINTQLPRAITDRFEQLLPKVADHMTTVSHMLHDLAIDRGARGVSLIHHGSEPFDIPAKGVAREELHLRPDAHYMGFMGRTINELSWIFDAMRVHRHQFPTLRLAICGVNAPLLAPHLDSLHDRVDSLGQVTPEQARSFAAAVDLGLLPLMDEPFNRSRFPVKLLDHAGAGKPVLCSSVGEAGAVGGTLSSVLLAGKTKADWITAFGDAAGRLIRNELPSLDMSAFRARWAWPQKAMEMIAIYRTSLQKVARRSVMPAIDRGTL